MMLVSSLLSKLVSLNWISSPSHSYFSEPYRLYTNFFHNNHSNRESLNRLSSLYMGCPQAGRDRSVRCVLSPFQSPTHSPISIKIAPPVPRLLKMNWVRAKDRFKIVQCNLTWQSSSTQYRETGTHYCTSWCCITCATGCNLPCDTQWLHHRYRW